MAIREEQPVPHRAELRELVYSKVFGDRVSEPELQLLVDSAEAEARSRTAGRMILERQTVAGFTPKYRYPENVVALLNRLGMERLQDEKIRKGTRELLEPLVGKDSLDFYVGIMRLGLGSGSPHLTQRSMAIDTGVSISTIRRKEVEIVDQLKSL